jgi:hypothetical protein
MDGSFTAVEQREGDGCGLLADRNPHRQVDSVARIAVMT